MNKDIEDFEYNNEEEAEIAQVLNLQLNQHALHKFQDMMNEKRSQPSLSHCEECGEPIPEERQAIVAGCTTCVDCQQINERKFR